MKLLVTGGGGFLGQALCRGLVARGHDVSSFNRGRYAALDAMGVSPEETIFVGDVASSTVGEPATLHALPSP